MYAARLCRGPSVNPVEHTVTVKTDQQWHANAGHVWRDWREAAGGGFGVCDNVTLAERGTLPQLWLEPTRSLRSRERKVDKSPTPISILTLPTELHFPHDTGWH